MPSSPGCSNAGGTYSATSRACRPCTRTCSGGLKTSARSSTTLTVRSGTRSSPGSPRSTPPCWPGCGNAATRRCTGVRSPAGTATGTTPRISPATCSPAQSQSRTGLAVHPQLRRALGKQTPASRPSRAETPPGGLRVLACPRHPRPLLPRAHLRGQHLRPRHPAHRRHPRRPYRTRLATNPRSGA